MRTLKNLSLTLFLIVLTSFATYSAILVKESFSSNASKKMGCGNTKSKRQFTHATVLNGKIVPQVTLPVVTISAKRNTKNIFSTIQKGKTRIAVVNLPEVLVVSERDKAHCSLNTARIKNERIIVVNLPEVTIVAHRVSQNSFAVLQTNENKVPFVNLPEVIISGDFPEYNKVTAILYKGHYIPSVNLQEVEITASRLENLIADETVQNDDLSSDYLESVKLKPNQSFSGVIFVIAKAMFFNF